MGLEASWTRPVCSTGGCLVVGCRVSSEGGTLVIEGAILCPRHAGERVAGVLTRRTLAWDGIGEPPAGVLDEAAGHLADGLDRID